MIGFTVNVNGDVIGRITARRIGVSDIEGDIIGVYECSYIRERSLDNRNAVEATIEHHYSDGWHRLLQKCLDAFSGPIQRDWDQRKPKAQRKRKPKGNSYEY